MRAAVSFFAVVLLGASFAVFIHFYARFLDATIGPRRDKV